MRDRLIYLKCDPELARKLGAVPLPAKYLLCFSDRIKADTAIRIDGTDLVWPIDPDAYRLR